MVVDFLGPTKNRTERKWHVVWRGFWMGFCWHCICFICLLIRLVFFWVCLKSVFVALHSSQKKQKIDWFRVSVGAPKMNHFHWKVYNHSPVWKVAESHTPQNPTKLEKKLGRFEAIPEDLQTTENPMASSYWMPNTSGLLLALCKSVSFQWRLLACFTNQGKGKDDETWFYANIRSQNAPTEPETSLDLPLSNSCRFLVLVCIRHPSGGALF